MGRVVSCAVETRECEVPVRRRPRAGTGLSAGTAASPRSVSRHWVRVRVAQKGFFSWCMNGKMFPEEFFQLTLMPPGLIAAGDAVATVNTLT